jgi:hypothetical protein
MYEPRATGFQVHVLVIKWLAMAASPHAAYYDFETTQARVLFVHVLYLVPDFLQESDQIWTNELGCKECTPEQIACIHASKILIHTHTVRYKMYYS